MREPARAPRGRSAGNFYDRSHTSKILDCSTCLRLTGFECLHINLACSEWLGKQSSFMKSLHDAIDFSLSIYRVISLIAVRTNKSRDVLDYY